ncbi:MAG: DUF4160 domain-containing protein [Eggerthella lenta]
MRTRTRALHDLRRLGGRARTRCKPVARTLGMPGGFVGKARAIRVGNRGTPRGKRAGTALDSHQIREEFPLDPRQQNVRWRRYNGRAGPRKRNNEPEEPLERIAMPEICTFYGIRITINWEKNAPHHKAHFHASYGGFEAVYSTEGELLAGKLPPRQAKLVVAWLLCTSRLDNNWYLKARTEPVFALTR